MQFVLGFEEQGLLAIGGDVKAVDIVGDGFFLGLVGGHVESLEGALSIAARGGVADEEEFAFVVHGKAAEGAGVDGEIDGAAFEAGEVDGDGLFGVFLVVLFVFLLVGVLFLFVFLGFCLALLYLSLLFIDK